MNNKGFAIIGILYTILILFLMIMVSVLAGLNTRKNFMKKSIESFQDDYLGSEVSESLTFFSKAEKKAIYTGKYIFTDNNNNNNNNNNSCFAYLKGGTSFSGILLTCENSFTSWNENYTLSKVYSFKKD